MCRGSGGRWVVLRYTRADCGVSAGTDPPGATATGGLLALLTLLVPPAGSSCGVVGRTGSGKSSLMLTLFRLIDVNAGSILLAGLDTASVALDTLRRQLAIIPQDPVLFSGTLR